LTSICVYIRIKRLLCTHLYVFIRIKRQLYTHLYVFIRIKRPLYTHLYVFIRIKRPLYTHLHVFTRIFTYPGVQSYVGGFGFSLENLGFRVSLFLREIIGSRNAGACQKNLFLGPLGPTRPQFRPYGATLRTAGEANERARYGGYGLAARVGI
jgi:hypothetical protein